MRGTPMNVRIKPLAVFAVNANVAIFAAVFVMLACDNRHNTVPPEESAAKFTQDLGIKVQGRPNCAGVDSDGDGYVTCTIALPAKDGEQPRTMSLQCAGVTSYTGCDAQTSKYVVGCKETQLKVLSAQGQQQ